jgi:hypothetical protein
VFGHEVVVALRLEPVEFGAPLRWVRHAGITYTQLAQLRPYPVSGTVRVAVAAGRPESGRPAASGPPASLLVCLPSGHARSSRATIVLSSSRMTTMNSTLFTARVTVTWKAS